MVYNVISFAVPLYQRIHSYLKIVNASLSLKKSHVLFILFILPHLTLLPYFPIKPYILFCHYRLVCIF